MPARPTAPIAGLRRHCRDKPGATANEFGDYAVLEGFLDSFARFVLDESPPVLLLRTHNAVRKKLEKTYPGIVVSGRMHWDTKGWEWTDVPLDGTVPADVLKALIDDSYQIVYEGLHDDARLEIALLGRDLSPRELLNELIDHYGLADRRAEIARLVRPAALLVTRRTPDARVPAGRSKIGGRPDLPAGVEWPRYQDGRPLAFLAQVNLADAAAAVPRLGLPSTGLMSFFSVFGWQVPDDADPQLPDGPYAEDWTRVLYAPNPTRLTRQKPPARVTAFPAAAAEFVPTLSLPDLDEPVVRGLGWKKAVRERYDNLVMAFRAASNRALGNPAPNLLGGYAEFIQQFVPEVADRDLRLVFQLASDPHAAMCWGDGGNVYFWAPAADVRRKRFDEVFTDYQCG